MKAYTFINSYICGIQVGIQAGHSIVELMSMNNNIGDAIVEEWAEKHKTFVWLDGGDATSIEDILNVALATECPVSTFHEPGMNGLMTSITVVLTSEQVEIVDLIRKYNLTLYDGADCPSFLRPDGSPMFRLSTYNLSVDQARLLTIIAMSRSKRL